MISTQSVIQRKVAAFRDVPPLVCQLQDVVQQDYGFGAPTSTSLRPIVARLLRGSVGPDRCAAERNPRRRDARHTHLLRRHFNESVGGILYWGGIKLFFLNL